MSEKKKKGKKEVEAESIILADATILQERKKKGKNIEGESNADVAKPRPSVPGSAVNIEGVSANQVSSDHVDSVKGLPEDAGRDGSMSAAALPPTIIKITKDEEEKKISQLSSFNAEVAFVSMLNVLENQHEKGPVLSNKPNFKLPPDDSLNLFKLESLEKSIDALEKKVKGVSRRLAESRREKAEVLRKIKYLENRLIQRAKEEMVTSLMNNHPTEKHLEDLEKLEEKLKTISKSNKDLKQVQKQREILNKTLKNAEGIIADCSVIKKPKHVIIVESLNTTEYRDKSGTRDFRITQLQMDEKEQARTVLGTRENFIHATSVDELASLKRGSRDSYDVESDTKSKKRHLKRLHEQEAQILESESPDRDPWTGEKIKLDTTETSEQDNLDKSDLPTDSQTSESVKPEAQSSDKIDDSYTKSQERPPLRTQSESVKPSAPSDSNIKSDFLEKSQEIPPPALSAESLKPEAQPSDRFEDSNTKSDVLENSEEIPPPSLSSESVKPEALSSDNSNIKSDTIPPPGTLSSNSSKLEALSSVNSNIKREKSGETPGVLSSESVRPEAQSSATIRSNTKSRDLENSEEMPPPGKMEVLELIGKVIPAESEHSSEKLRADNKGSSLQEVQPSKESTLKSKYEDVDKMSQPSKQTLGSKGRTEERDKEEPKQTEEAVKYEEIEKLSQPSKQTLGSKGRTEDKDKEEPKQTEEAVKYEEIEKLSQPSKQTLGSKGKTEEKNKEEPKQTAEGSSVKNNKEEMEKISQPSKQTLGSKSKTEEIGKEESKPITVGKQQSDVNKAEVIPIPSKVMASKGRADEKGMEIPISASKFNYEELEKIVELNKQAEKEKSKTEVMGKEESKPTEESASKSKYEEIEKMSQPSKQTLEDKGKTEEMNSQPSKQTLEDKNKTSEKNKEEPESTLKSNHEEVGKISHPSKQTLGSKSKTEEIGKEESKPITVGKQQSDVNKTKEIGKEESKPINVGKEQSDSNKAEVIPIPSKAMGASLGDQTDSRHKVASEEDPKLKTHPSELKSASSNVKSQDRVKSEAVLKGKESEIGQPAKHEDVPDGKSQSGFETKENIELAKLSSAHSKPENQSDGKVNAKSVENVNSNENAGKQSGLQTIEKVASGGSKLKEETGEKSNEEPHHKSKETVIGVTSSTNNQKTLENIQQMNKDNEQPNKADTTNAQNEEDKENDKPINVKKKHLTE